MSPRPLTRHAGIVAPLLRPNIDTDAIIPSREMKRVSRRGLGEGLFAGWRYLSAEHRTPDPDFVLNRPEYREATIIAAGPNFGCGSSREHAVWALAEYGIRVIIAPSFGAIFERNCINNGVAPIALPEDAIAELVEATSGDPQRHRLTVDLEARVMRVSDRWEQRFDMDERSRHMLLEGLDPVELTLEYADAIERFEAQDRQSRPWAYRWSGEEA